MPELNQVESRSSDEVVEFLNQLNAEERFVDRVKLDYEMSKRALKHRHDKFLGYLQRYYNKDNTDRPAGMAASTVPLINEAVNVIVADIIDKEFQTELNIDARGREPSDDYAATAIREMIKYQCEVNGAKAKLAETAFSMVLYGMGPAKVFYEEQWIDRSKWVSVPLGVTGMMDYQQVDNSYLKYKGPVLEPIDILDWFPHPDKKKINDRLPQIQRFYPSESELKEREKAGTYHNVDVVVEAIRSKQLSHDAEGMSLKERRHKLSGTQFEKNMLADNPECLEWQGWFDLEGTGDEKFCVGVVAIVNSEENDNNYQVLRLEECTYHDHEPTYICARFFRVPGEFWAIGVGEMLESDEDTATGLLRAQLDSYYRLARPRTKIIQGALVDENELKLPWGTVHLYENEYGTDAYREEPVQPIGADGFNLYNQVQTNSKARSGVAEIMAGRIPGQKTTATVGSHAFTQASARFKHMLWMFEESLVLPMCEKFLAINQQFIDKPYAIYILGEAGMYWVQVSPDQIAGRVNFIAVGSTKEADRQVNIEQLMRLIQIFSANPMLMAAVPILGVNIAEEFQLRNLRDIKAALGYEMMMAQIQQAKQMQMTPAQMLAMQGIMYQQPAPGGNGSNPRNTVPYGGNQEQTPVNQEEMLAKTNQRMTSNFPIAR
jgi:hypothetical protein